MFLRCESVTYLLKEIFIQEFYIFDMDKLSDYSFTKYAKLGSLYVLINGDSVYVTYISR